MVHTNVGVLHMQGQSSEDNLTHIKPTNPQEVGMIYTGMIHSYKQEGHTQVEIIYIILAT